MPTVDLSLHGLLEGNFFNFIILFALIIWLLVKFNVSEIIEQAQKGIEELLKKSDDEKRASEKELSTVKKEVENLPEELAQIKQDAQNTVDAFRKAAQEEIAQTAQRLEANAQKAIENEVQKINSDLQRVAALQAIETAHKKTLNKLSANVDLHRKFIDEAINKIEELEI